MSMQLRPQGFLWLLCMDLQSSSLTPAHCNCSHRCRPAEFQHCQHVVRKTIHGHGKCESGTNLIYLLGNCKSLRAAAFTMVVVTTGATWCPEACKLDAADDLACFGTFQTKCWPRSLHLLLGRDPAINLVGMILRHVCTHTCCLFRRKWYLARVTTKLLKKDYIIAAWLEKRTGYMIPV